MAVFGWNWSHSCEGWGRVDGLDMEYPVEILPVVAVNERFSGTSRSLLRREMLVNFSENDF